MPLAIAGVTFITVALLSWVVFRPKEDVVARRISSGWTQASLRDRRLEASAGSRWIWPFFNRVGTAIAHTLPHNMVRNIDHMLLMANQPMSLPAFLALWGASVVFGSIIFVYVTLLVPDPPLALVIALVFFLFILFGLGPYAVLRRRVRRRQRSITHELPYALDLIVTCVEAGLGVDAAFAAVT